MGLLLFSRRNCLSTSGLSARASKTGEGAPDDATAIGSTFLGIVATKILLVRIVERSPPNSLFVLVS